MCALTTVDSPLTVGNHRRTVRSFDAEAIRLPEGADATDSTASLWPRKRKARSCSLKFQTMTQPSRPPETSCFMLGLKQTEEIASLWPRKERSREGSTGEAAMIDGKEGQRPAFRPRFSRRPPATMLIMSVLPVLGARASPANTGKLSNFHR